MQAVDPSARAMEQGVRVLGTPLGHVDFVEAQLTKKLAEHNVFLPRLVDVQSIWSSSGFGDF